MNKGSSRANKNREGRSPGNKDSQASNRDSKDRKGNSRVSKGNKASKEVDKAAAGSKVSAASRGRVKHRAATNDKTASHNNRDGGNKTVLGVDRFAGAAEQRGQGETSASSQRAQAVPAGQSPEKVSVSGPTGCATSRNCSMIPSCERRPRGSAIALGPHARSTSGTPRRPTGTSCADLLPNPSMSFAIGSPRRCGGVRRPTPWSPSIAIRFRPGSPRV